jgi:ABC-type branched-subunit amino acid transport system permease subunit
MNMTTARFYTIGATLVIAFATTPAMAGVPVTPAPIAGLGIGAFAVVAIGYRALKRRLDR